MKVALFRTLTSSSIDNRCLCTLFTPLGRQDIFQSHRRNLGAGRRGSGLNLAPSGVLSMFRALAPDHSRTPEAYFWVMCQKPGGLGAIVCKHTKNMAGASPVILRLLTTQQKQCIAHPFYTGVKFCEANSWAHEALVRVGLNGSWQSYVPFPFRRGRGLRSAYRGIPSASQASTD